MQVQILTWQLSVERIKPSSEDLINKYNAVAHGWQQKIQRFGYDKAYASLFAPATQRFAQQLRWT